MERAEFDVVQRLEAAATAAADATPSGAAFAGVAATIPSLWAMGEA